ncbi:hypothetical protein OS493_018241 [Desmophyllum pertusum]|uniref:Uncharacterized protein n=1 Tax=Desmophyllum pertusum TaxID=174260 RepID=A0A9X0CGI7_9CNID|nr:hypothetical protein OS493_018241 [Desmophyllum pertusum]
MSNNLRAISQGCGAQTVIFFLAMLSSAVICPALGKFRDHVITALIALGSASLAGDAIFHLLPHALNADFHHENGGTTTADNDVVLWRSLLVVCSLYFFYLFHLFFHVVEGGHSHSHATLPESGENMNLIQNEAASKPKPAESKSNKALIGMMLLGEVLHTASDGFGHWRSFFEISSRRTEYFTCCAIS